MICLGGATEDGRAHAAKTRAGLAVEDYLLPSFRVAFSRSGGNIGHPSAV